MTNQLGIHIEHHGSITVVNVSGFFAQLEVYRFKSQFETLLGDGRRHLVLDMTNVTLLDSAGIGSIIQLRKETHTRHGILYIVQSVTPQVRQALAHSSLDKLIPTFQDVTDARQTMVRNYHLSTVKEENTQPRLAKSDDTEINSEHGADLKRIVRMLEAIQERLDRIENRMPVPEINPLSPCE